MRLLALASPAACALALGAGCAAPADGGWQDLYARAAAVELEGDFLSEDGRMRIHLRAAAPASGELILERETEFFGQRSSSRERWIGDGTAIYAVDDEKRECAYVAAAWRDMEELARLHFLAPAWTRPAPPPARLDVTTGAGGAIVAARGADDGGSWSFAAARSRALRAADPRDYALPLPAGHAVLGAPDFEFDHVRSLLAVGEFAPEITLIGLDGRERVLSEFRGRQLLVAFWFYH